MKGDSYLFSFAMSSTGTSYTDKKGDQIYLKYKEIQRGSVAKLYMTDGLFIYG
jgi:hypothetical protein